MKKTVLVAMSGGVDSSVAAALLLEKGFRVSGATIRISDDLNSPMEDAKRVARVLGIEHHIFDFREEFKEKVTDYFVKTYLEGRTPNPCVACNKHIKFHSFLNMANHLNIEMIATGHYARVVFDGKYRLMKAVTKTKDQSYALYNLKQDNLGRILMPVGEYEKDEIRDLARGFNLPVAKKPDSQEICFIANNDYVDFITKYMDKDELDKYNRPGEMVDVSGNILGEHRGIINYTIGQRKGLGVISPKPLFVVGINARENRVVLGESKDTFTREMMVEKVNFIASDISDTFDAHVKIRYSAKEAKARINILSDGNLKIVFDAPQRAITPGQSAVIYQGDEVLGGGIITLKGL